MRYPVDEPKWLLRKSTKIAEQLEHLERDRPTAPFRAPGCSCGQLVTASCKNDLPHCPSGRTIKTAPQRWLCQRRHDHVWGRYLG
jgi:hypothetical protein